MGILKKLVAASALSAGLAFAGAAFAGPIPYPNPGTVNRDVYMFTAASDGEIVAYFVGSSASLEENIGLWVNGVSTGITGLNNHTSSVGDSVDLGFAHAGDTLVFAMYIPPASGSPLPPPTWVSDPSGN